MAASTGVWLKLRRYQQPAEVDAGATLSCRPQQLFERAHELIPVEKTLWFVVWLQEQAHNTADGYCRADVLGVVWHAPAAAEIAADLRLLESLVRVDELH